MLDISQTFLLSLLLGSFAFSVSLKTSDLLLFRLLGSLAFSLSLKHDVSQMCLLSFLLFRVSLRTYLKYGASLMFLLFVCSFFFCIFCLIEARRFLFQRVFCFFALLIRVVHFS